MMTRKVLRMRNRSAVLISLIVAFLTASCSKPSDPDDANELYGTWVMAEYEESATILRRSSELNADEYGFIIHPGGRFTERKNAGFCGTPPISYANFEGDWTHLSENLLDINVGYWGGTTSFKIEIISLSSAELKILYYFDD